MFFPYDIEDYLECRNLFVDYNEFAFGSVVKTASQLVSKIEDMNWLHGSKYNEKRKAIFKKYFPYGETCYARRSYEKICQLQRH